MTKFKDGFSSESFYPDSDYLLNQDNTPEETSVLDVQIPSMGGGLNGQITIGLLRKEQMEGLQ